MRAGGDGPSVESLTQVPDSHWLCTECHRQILPSVTLQSFQHLLWVVLLHSLDLSLDHLFMSITILLHFLSPEVPYIYSIPNGAKCYVGNISVRFNFVFRFQWSFNPKPLFIPLCSYFNAPCFMWRFSCNLESIRFTWKNSTRIWLCSFL
jgi:hypothetical protein